MTQKHIHFIGICGVAMSALAIAFKKAGFEVSGSDVGFFPPVSTNLEKHQIKFYPGWHPEKMIENGIPDLIVVGNVASSTNPEWLYVQEHKLNFKSYPEAIEEFFTKENSIVCAGTYGKTTTSALLAWILSECGYNPSYMFGGIAIEPVETRSFASLPSAKITNGEWSVVEGDEYKSARWDNGAKFFHYHPTHLLLTAVEWDHADVYPTKESYIDAFRKLISTVPKKGLIVISERILDIKILDINHNIQYPISKTYGIKSNCDYQYKDIKTTKKGIIFNIFHKNNEYKIKLPMLGEYMADNLTAVFAMAHQIGIEPEKIISAIARFKGLKRRLEKRFDGKITVFDDIAHSPTKAKSVLETLATVYKCHPERSEGSLSHNQNDSSSLRSLGMTGSRIICIFEPNTGNRQAQSTPSYDQAFKDADEVIIPKLTKLKTSEELKHWEGQELADIIAKTHNNVKYIEDDNELINYLITNSHDGDVIVFCGSHGFRGMIDLLISRLTQKSTRN